MGVFGYSQIRQGTVTLEYLATADLLFSNLVSLMYSVIMVEMWCLVWPVSIVIQELRIL